MEVILSHLRRCIEDYEMIRPGDRIAVGVSGGKDSLILLYAMAKLKRFYPLPFELHAITVHPGTPEMDFSGVAEAVRGAGGALSPASGRRFSTSSSICAKRRTPAPCAPKCAGGPSTTPWRSWG